jgi:intracellular sulfur oxidation DsrE/DsrF family protein
MNPDLKYRIPVSLLIVLAVLSICGVANAQPGRAQPGRGQGQGFGPGFGRGPGRTEGMREDMTTLHAMFAARDKITRTVNLLPDGAETITESGEPQIAALLKEHIPAMESRVHDNKPLPPMTFHPIFIELIKHADDYRLTYKETDNGMKVTYAADDPFVIMLVQEHAKLVSRFIDNGMEEIHKPYKLPSVASSNTDTPDATEPSTQIEYINPAIRNYGKVVKLPRASHQPRDGSKIVVDVTKGGDAATLNPAIEKVARFVNIYRGAGKAPSSVDIAIVLHGDATLASLNADAYANRFRTESNPNLDCLRQLHEAGVEIFVCGQSLIGKGAQPQQVIDYVDVAVSALTTMVNLQTDGYAYVPLAN